MVKKAVKKTKPAKKIKGGLDRKKPSKKKIKQNPNALGGTLA